jgi:hypothetical protein
MTLQELLGKADAIALGRVLYVSVNGEEAIPVRGVSLDVDECGVQRIVLTNEEGPYYG